LIARVVGPSDDLLMLQALLDGELDASGVIDMERRIAADPRLAAEYARLRALRGAIQGGAMREVAPANLRARIAAATGVDAASSNNVVRFPDAAARPATNSLRRWRAVAGAMAAAVVALVGVNVYLVSDWGSNDLERAAVAAHSRGLISGQPVDVVSTDRHTVKPWLAGKVPLATTVVDLATDGYALTGGRVDVIDEAPVPTLVYRHREHVISLTELSRGSARPSSPTRETVSGHSVVTWSDNVRRYVAVSDMPPPELDDFVSTFRRAAASEREDAPQPAK
jgi:anti-sigma factor RsiW